MCVLRGRFWIGVCLVGLLRDFELLGWVFLGRCCDWLTFTGFVFAGFVLCSFFDACGVC